jgi:hypothetical protein
MGALDWNAIVPLLMGSGVLAQGLAAMRWAARVESRLDALEGK